MEASGRKVVDLNIEDVLPNRFQPRIKFNEDAINELCKSIKEHGVIQPIVVRPIGDKYEIIAGERRYKASCMAELKTIPAIITDLNDKDSAEVALIENVQREDLTPIEEAISYKKILDMGYITQDALAGKLGKNQSTVANKLRLLNLDDEVQEALLNEKISERHARSLLKLQNKEQQRTMLEKIIKERLTVRKADEEIEKVLAGEPIKIQQNIDFASEPKETPNIEEEKDNMEERKFKFINPVEIEQSNEPVEEQEEPELKEELIPKKFFNLLEQEESQEEPNEFKNMFINPNINPEKENIMEEEVKEIENSINNSKTLPPIFNSIEETPVEQPEEEKEPEEQKTIKEHDDFEDEFELIDDEEPQQMNEEIKPKEIEVSENTIHGFKDILEKIRKCSSDIEEAGFGIETEEIDLGNIYQVTFKIKND